MRRAGSSISLRSAGRGPSLPSLKASWILWGPPPKTRASASTSSISFKVTFIGMGELSAPSSERALEIKWLYCPPKLTTGILKGKPIASFVLYGGRGLRRNVVIDLLYLWASG